MAKMYYQDDADLSVIQDKAIGVIGYGSQGHAHALNLKDSGQKVLVGLHPTSRSREKRDAFAARLGPRLDAPLTIQRGVIRGVVDLVFTHEGRTYFLDWKSDRVPVGELRSHVDASYGLQAKLYTLGLARVLRLHDQAAYDARFGGLLYVFLRHGDQGVVFDRPSWDEVTRWDEELRAERPWGYGLGG